jgi:aldose 1-epimerase
MVDPESFGTLPDGRAVQLYRLRSDSGVDVSVCTYGAAITSILAPGRDGTRANVVLGFDSVTPYLSQTAYLGAVVGRYANRIAGARFVLDGITYLLTANEGSNLLHGGARGFDKQLWEAEPFTRDRDQGVRLTRISPAGEEGFPGRLQVAVEYLLTAVGALQCSFTAETDAPTIVNLAQHAYFNLSGTATPVLDHELTIAASRYTPIGADLIPTGALDPVAETPFDLRTPRRIGDRIDDPHPQLRFGRGYDHNWVLDRDRRDADDRSLAHAATVRHARGGRRLDVFTTEPGLQFYSGNFLDGTLRGHQGTYVRRAGLCLETQKFPDTPNQPAFPTAVLRPGERYYARTTFAFSQEDRRDAVPQR